MGNDGGGITLWRGDCLELMNDLPANSVAMVLADLPYGCTDCAWDKRIDLAALWERVKRVRRPGAAVALFALGLFMVDLVQSNRKEYRYKWVWEKTMAVGFANANKMPLRAHEDICLFYDRLPTYHPQMWQGKPYTRNHQRRAGSLYAKRPSQRATLENGGAIVALDGRRYPRDVVKFANPHGTIDPALVHPTAKPVPLLEYLIRTYTDPGDLVLDCCMGSGSTCVAAVNTGRRAVGIELDERYYNIAVARVAQARAAQQLALED